MEHFAQCVWPQLDVCFCSATEQWCGMALAGPKSRDVLAAVVDGADVSNDALPYMGLLETTCGGAPARVFRISFSGELAYEINTPWGCGEAVWERCMAAGKSFGIVPYGTEALSIMRIEKGHVAGQELDGRTTAADLGLGRMVSTKKPFVGQSMSQRPGMTDPDRPSLVGVRPADPTQRLRGGAHLVEDPATANGHTTLGWVSSVHSSPTVGSWIGLGFVKGGLEAWQGRRLCAFYPLKDERVVVDICQPCFVDPDGERLRG
jgi:sarcosine oxidase subunit alpha